MPRGILRAVPPEAVQAVTLFHVEYSGQPPVGRSGSSREAARRDRLPRQIQGRALHPSEHVLVEFAVGVFFEQRAMHAIGSHRAAAMA